MLNLKTAHYFTSRPWIAPSYDGAARAGEVERNRMRFFPRSSVGPDLSSR
jgi:hypothetical protein